MRPHGMAQTRWAASRTDDLEGQCEGELRAPRANKTPSALTKFGKLFTKPG
jgi:hypothetical protein